MHTITIPRRLIKNEGGVVVLPLKEYRKLCEMAVPTYYIKGKAAKDLDKLVQDGVREYREGKTISAVSLREALKLYGKRNKKS